MVWEFATGDVGIGTIDPTERLHVVGKIVTVQGVRRFGRSDATG